MSVNMTLFAEGEGLPHRLATREPVSDILK